LLCFYTLWMRAMLSTFWGYRLCPSSESEWGFDAADPCLLNIWIADCLGPGALVTLKRDVYPLSLLTRTAHQTPPSSQWVCWTRNFTYINTQPPCWGWRYYV
jgi:hypothetical protein